MGMKEDKDAKMPSEEDEEDERVQVAPNMGAGGSHLQATTDPEEEAAEEEGGTRKQRWADCDDKEEEDHREAVRKSVEMMQKEKVEQAVTVPGEEGWKRNVMRLLQR